MPNLTLNQRKAREKRFTNSSTGRLRHTNLVEETMEDLMLADDVLILDDNDIVDDDNAVITLEDALRSMGLCKS